VIAPIEPWSPGIDADLGERLVARVRERLAADGTTVDAKRRDLVARVVDRQLHLPAVRRAPDDRNGREVDERRVVAAIAERVPEHGAAVGKIASALDGEVEAIDRRLLTLEPLQRRVEGARLIGAAGEKKSGERAHGSATEQLSGPLARDAIRAVAPHHVRRVPASEHTRQVIHSCVAHEGPSSS
jgi:hypothetical protein